MSETRKLAVFDFDNTLIHGDSLWPFLTAVAGTPRALWALFNALVLFQIRRMNKESLTAPEMRTFIKAYLLKKILGGRRMGSLGPAIEKVHAWCTWNEPVRQVMLDHFAQGHHIVIVSGALNLYLPELLKDFPPHQLICTSVKIKNDVITGEMSSENCVRKWKADMLAEYLATQEPFVESWGYGNFPHDVPMLNLLKHQIIIS
jgi:phosphatidylglycerophosphatase C